MFDYLKDRYGFTILVVMGHMFFMILASAYYAINIHHGGVAEPDAIRSEFFLVESVIGFVLLFVALTTDIVNANRQDAIEAKEMMYRKIILNALRKEKEYLGREEINDEHITEIYETFGWKYTVMLWDLKVKMNIEQDFIYLCKDEDTIRGRVVGEKVRKISINDCK